jgi:triacylglycerol lipase
MSGFSFNPNTTRYDSNNAYWSARASELAYGDEAAIRGEVVGNWGLDDDKFHFFDEGDTQAFLAGNADMLLVAFRGTEPTKLSDWMSDAHIHLVEGPAGRVHHGFKSALDDVWSDVLGSIEELQDNAQSLWFTGHSLGAALAALAVARLRLEYDRPVHGLYTFGMPRTGDRDFARTFNVDFKAQCFRFVNNNDVVTRVPPRALTYSHVGRFLFFDSRGNLHDDIRWWWKFLDRVRGRIDDFLKPGTDGIKDHSMDRYVENLERNMTVVPSWH